MTIAHRRPLPIGLEEIDCEWLNSVLRELVSTVILRDFSIVDMQRGACTKLRLHLDFDDSGDRGILPERVILKGGFEAHSRDMFRMHDREVRGYRDVFPVLRLPTPACYFADSDAGRRQGIVIMEDLTCRGVTFCSVLCPLSEDDVARRLSVLARYHAQTWGSADLSLGGRWVDLPHVLEATRRTYQAFLDPDRWRHVLLRPRSAAAAARFRSPDWVTSSLDRLLAFSCSLPHVVVHGDTHLGNLYADRDGAPGFLDSIPGRSPAMEEISYFIAGALEVADRRRCEEYLIRHYLAELHAHGVEAPSFDKAMHQYAMFLARGYVVFMCNDSAFQAEAINAAQVARFSHAMFDHNTATKLANTA